MPHPLLLTTLLLIASSVFMTFAWHGHLKKLYPVAVASSGADQLGQRAVRVFIAGADRIGFGTLNMSQLKRGQGGTHRGSAAWMNGGTPCGLQP